MDLMKQLSGKQFSLIHDGFAAAKPAHIGAEPTVDLESFIEIVQSAGRMRDRSDSLTSLFTGTGTIGRGGGTAGTAATYSSLDSHSLGKSPGMSPGMVRGNSSFVNQGLGGGAAHSLSYSREGEGTPGMGTPGGGFGVSPQTDDLVGQLSRASLMTLFHQIDYRHQEKITWDEFSMFVVDDLSKTKVASNESTGRMDRYHPQNTILQLPIGRGRQIKYIPSPKWDYVARITSFSTAHNIELLHPTTLAMEKASPSQAAPIFSIEVLPKHNLIAAANGDISMTFWSTESAIEEDDRSSKKLHLAKHVGFKELEESVMSNLWHPKYNDKLFSGTRSGSLLRWDLNLESRDDDKRCRVASRHPLHSGSVMCMIPWEDRIISSGMDGTIRETMFKYSTKRDANSAGREWLLEEPEKPLKGHKQGVLSLELIDYLNNPILVSAGFEREPFLWPRHLNKPWKLSDKNNPHTADIYYLFSPPGTPQVISADIHGLVKVWDIRTYQCMQTLATERLQRAAVGEVGATTAAEHQLNFSHVTYDTRRSTMIASGPRCSLFLKGDLPLHLARADDNPISRALYNSTAKCFATAHGNSIKIWDEVSGAAIAVFKEITPAEISAICLDHRGRKLFIGDRKGNVFGHVFTTGVRFHTYPPIQGPVKDLVYTRTRNGKQQLLVAGKDNVFLSHEDDDDQKSIPITQPLTFMRAALFKQGHKVDKISVGCLTAQSKLSIVYFACGNTVIAVDLGSLTTLHVLTVNADVAVVSHMGDLPAVAIVDVEGQLSVYAIRPSLHQETLLLQVSLMNTSESGTLPTTMTFHQNKRRLFIGDTTGTMEVWDLSAFVEFVGLTPACYPLSLVGHVLKKHTELPEDLLASTKRMPRVVKCFEAHADEITASQVIITAKTVTLLTAGYDQSVKLWDSAFKSLGELSQGRIEDPEKATDAEEVYKHYRRHNIENFDFIFAEGDEDEDELQDMDASVKKLFNRAIHKYRAKKRNEEGGDLPEGSFSASHSRQSSPISSQRRQSFFSAKSTKSPVSKLAGGVNFSDSTEISSGMQRSRGSRNTSLVARQQGEDGSPGKPVGRGSRNSSVSMGDLERSSSTSQDEAAVPKGKWEVMTTIKIAEGPDLLHNVQKEQSHVALTSQNSQNSMYQSGVFRNEMEKTSFVRSTGRSKFRVKNQQPTAPAPAPKTAKLLPPSRSLREVGGSSMIERNDLMYTDSTVTREHHFKEYQQERAIAEKCNLSEKTVNDLQSALHRKLEPPTPTNSEGGRTPHLPGLKVEARSRSVGVNSTKTRKSTEIGRHSRTSALSTTIPDLPRLGLNRGGQNLAEIRQPSTAREREIVAIDRLFGASETKVDKSKGSVICHRPLQSTKGVSKFGSTQVVRYFGTQ